jgi:tetratricopeptide (TPR) repeat protein
VVLIAILVGCRRPTASRTAAGMDDANAVHSARSGSYAGSESCKKCHREIYERWRSTRHSFSILPAAESRKAGYPLPPARSGVRGWRDISYTVGGRKRIAYVDANGIVRATSFHHRSESWQPFPVKKMDCAPCHVTGDVELNIGCEACHGPGSRHVKTYRKQDIVLDVSARVCGRCHTAAGRVLPPDQFNASHDLVQVWNHDPHTTGVRFQSHNAFCARCHSPYDGQFLESDTAATTLVFSESKKNLTCISCHDPHSLSDAAYTRRQAALHAPRPPRLQVFQGKDGSAISKFAEFKESSQVCIQCHTGADRIDLDHGNAGCADCHNTFHYNRQPATAIEHDANRPALSCRPCHSDADHLLTIVFQDADFLKPKYIHNLRKLPAGVAEKYQLRYSGIAYSPQPVQALDQPNRQPRVAPPSRFQPAGERTSDNLATQLEKARASLDKRRFDEARELLNTILRADPDNAAALHLLGLVHLRQRNLMEAREALRRSFSRAPNLVDAGYALARVSLLMGQPGEAIRAYRKIIERQPGLAEAHFRLGGLYKYLMDSAAFQSESLQGASPEFPDLAADRRFRDLLKGSESEYAQQALAELAVSLRLQPLYWPAIRQVGEIYRRSGRLQEAGEIFQWLADHRPEDWIYWYRLGTVLIQRNRYRDALEPLRRAIELAPTQGDPYLALGLAHVKLGHAAQALAVWEKGTAHEPFNPALYINLGAAHASRGAYIQAKEHLNRAIALGTFPLPKLHLAYTNLGLIAAKQGDFQAAVTAFRHALHIFPEYAPARRLLRSALSSSRGAGASGEKNQETAPARPRVSHLKIASRFLRREPGDDFVYYEMLEIFGEVTTMEFVHE